jgi:hypothetical protein
LKKALSDVDIAEQERNTAAMALQEQEQIARADKESASRSEPADALDPSKKLDALVRSSRRLANASAKLAAYTTYDMSITKVTVARDHLASLLQSLMGSDFIEEKCVTQ